MPERMAKQGIRKRQPIGQMLRPEAVVLNDAALVPARNRVKPPPNQFTHVVLRAQPYFFEAAQDRGDGQLSEGTRVVLMVHDGGQWCRVVDEQGLYVETAYDGLRAL